MLRPLGGSSSSLRRSRQASRRVSDDPAYKIFMSRMAADQNTPVTEPVPVPTPLVAHVLRTDPAFAAFMARK
jgi:hypothetical protein